MRNVRRVFDFNYSWWGAVPMEKNEQVYKPLLWSEKYTLLASSMRRLVSFSLLNLTIIFLSLPENKLRFLPSSFSQSSVDANLLSACISLSFLLSPRPKPSGRWAGESLSLPSYLLLSIFIRKWVWNAPWSWFTQDLVCMAEWLRSYGELGTLFLNVNIRPITFLLWGAQKCSPDWQSPSSDPVPFFPCDCFLALAVLSSEMALLLPVERCCFLLQVEEIWLLHVSTWQDTSCHTKGELSTSPYGDHPCWVPYKTAQFPRQVYVSLFGQAWCREEVGTDMPRKGLAWISNCLLDVQGIHFSFQTSHKLLLCHLNAILVSHVFV